MVSLALELDENLGRFGAPARGSTLIPCAMSENAENLILEHLRAIRGVLSDHGERLNRIELRLSAIEQTLGSLYALRAH
jgi:hypothetical protein